jgi:hypothetical protein
MLTICNGGPCNQGQSILKDLGYTTRRYGLNTLSEPGDTSCYSMHVQVVRVVHILCPRITARCLIGTARMHTCAYVHTCTTLQISEPQSRCLYHSMLYRPTIEGQIKFCSMVTREYSVHTRKSSRPLRNFPHSTSFSRSVNFLSTRPYA